VVLATNLFCSRQRRAKRLPPIPAEADSRQTQYNRTIATWSAQRGLHHQHLQAVADPPTCRHAIRDADATTCSQPAHLPPARLRNPWSIRHEAEVQVWSPCNRSCRTVGFGLLRTENERAEETGRQEDRGRLKTMVHWISRRRDARRDAERTDSTA
jgi:hypothetical protein